MKTSSRRRLTVDLLRTAVAFLSCCTLGIGVGLVFALRGTEVKLSRFAIQLLQYADESTREINLTLDEVNASPFPLCSDEDLARMRKIVFHGRLIKDLGRERGGELYCTSVCGRFDHPLKLNKPDIVTPSGRAMRLDVPLLGAPGMFGNVTRSGEADFVTSRDTFSHLAEAPMGYTITLTNRQLGQVVWAAGSPLRLSGAEVLGEKERYRGGTIYLARCSTINSPCVVASITLEDAWKLNRSLVSGFGFIGLLSGIAVGVLLLLQPGQKRLATQLKRAIRLNQLTVVYQPVVELKSGRIVGAEALARWINEEGNYVRPDVFIAAAEELGFIGKLTRVVAKLIVTELGEFLRSHPEFSVNLNIAAADLVDPQFGLMLDKLLKKHDVSTRSINLELTERSTASHKLAIQSIRELRERGHRVYIDDFGTGYSSLSYLHELSIDAIKIDRAFTDAIGTGSLTAAIVPQILGMASALRVEVVVEGVERVEQSIYFAALDQNVLAQGWHFGQPLPAQELIRFVEVKEAERTALPVQS